MSAPGRISTVIITPIYRPTLSASEVELISLSGRTTPYPQIFVTPSGMDTTALREFFPHHEIVSTDPDNLASTHSYNHWLTSSAFYDMWSDFEWILIAQFDALLRSDPWLDLGTAPFDWDYLGAPWSPPMRVVTIGTKILVRSPSGADRGPAWVEAVGRKLSVGNGGLSLRRREAFSAAAHVIEKWIPTRTRVHTNEDVLWAAFGPRMGITVARREQAERVFWESIDAESLAEESIPRVSGYHGIDRWPAAVRNRFLSDVRDSLDSEQSEHS